MKDIVFDLGGVLIDWNPRYLYKKIFASTEEMEWFLSNVCTPEWNARQDAGRPFAEALALVTEKYPKYAAQINDYYARWEETLGGPIKGTVALWQELKNKGCHIYALTNWSAETFPIAKQKYDFLQKMDGIVVSGEEKMNKPNPEIYKRLLARYGLQANNCVYIDDSLPNVEAAAQLGFDVVHFVSPEVLRLELLKRGLL